MTFSMRVLPFDIICVLLSLFYFPFLLLYVVVVLPTGVVNVLINYISGVLIIYPLTIIS